MSRVQKLSSSTKNKFDGLGLETSCSYEEKTWLSGFQKLSVPINKNLVCLGFKNLVFLRRRNLTFQFSETLYWNKEKP